MLNIKKEQDNDKLTFALEGRLDTVTSPELESAVKKRIPEKFHEMNLKAVRLAAGE